MVKRYIPILLAVIITIAVIRAFVQPFPLVNTPEQTKSPTPTILASTKTFSYSGKDNTDALTLLLQKTAIAQDVSGMITSINGYKADPSKREYWAFYVNGKMAQVGAKDYVTKNSDKIEWRIKKY